MAAAVAAATSVRIDLLAGKGGFDDRLALFDHLRAGFGRGGKRDGCSCGAGTGEQLSGGIAGPADETEQRNEKHRLKRCGNTEATKLGAVMDEQIAIAKQARRCGQHLRHLIPAPPTGQARKNALPKSQIFKELPSPRRRANCPATHWRQSHCFRMVNKFNLWIRGAGQIVR